MKKSAKILPLLLAWALILPLLASCADKEPTGSLNAITAGKLTAAQTSDTVTVGVPGATEAPVTTAGTTLGAPETTDPATTTAAETTKPTTATVPETTGPATTATPETTRPETTTTKAPVTTRPETTTTKAPVTTRPETTTTKAPVTTKPETTTTKAPETTKPTTTAAPETTDKTPEPSVPEEPDRAQVYVQALDGLMRKINADYYSRSNHRLNNEPRSGRAYLWGFGAYLEALAEWYSISPDDARSYYVDALDNGLAGYRVTASRLTTPAGTFRNIVYYNAGAGGQGDYYYDDNAWICYQLLNAYVQLGDQKYLDEAERLLEFFKTGWDDKLGGGIYWDKSFSGKNTCDNGPIAICFLWAYQLTEKEDYLEWGKKVFDWLDSTLRDGNLYSDNINLKREINYWKADYNQGTPIYAACLLYEITGETIYLNRARSTASAALSHAFGGSGTNVYLNGNPIFKSWCVGWLMRGFEKYVAVSGLTGSYYRYMEIVLDRTLANPRSDGYYDPYFGAIDWPSESRTEVLQPSGVASVIAICARYEIAAKSG